MTWRSSRNFRHLCVVKDTQAQTVGNVTLKKSEVPLQSHDYTYKFSKSVAQWALLLYSNVTLAGHIRILPRHMRWKHGFSLVDCGGLNDITLNAVPSFECFNSLQWHFNGVKWHFLQLLLYMFIDLHSSAKYIWWWLKSKIYFFSFPSSENLGGRHSVWLRQDR